MDTKEIKRLLKPPKTQIGLARALGVDPSAVSRLLRGGRELKAREIDKVREYFERPEGAPVNRPTFTQIPGGDPRDTIPVMGVSEGGEDGQSLWNGEAVDYIQRPPSLANAPHGYATFVVGSSMEPRYMPGETIYVHPGKPVTIGCFVLVQLRPKNDGEPPPALVKRLAKKTGSKLILEQFTPPKPFDVPLAEVVSVHRIVGSAE